jgi:hypothetical protein
MFHAEYSSGQPLRMLVDLRSVVDAALARTAKSSASKQPPVPAPRAKAAAAQAALGPEIIEFEVASGSPDWGQDDAKGQKPDPDDGNA